MLCDVIQMLSPRWTHPAPDRMRLDHAMTSSLELIAKGKYLSLTTFRRDGTPVATPVWLARDGDALVVTTEVTSGKVKRLRNNPDVLIAPCDVRGTLKGSQVPAQATLQDASSSQRTAQLIKRRYGLLGRLLMRRGRPEDRIGIVITLR